MEQKHSFTFNFKNTYLLKSLFFLVSLVVLALLFEYFFEKKVILNSQSSSSYKINRILKLNNENEIPIFGASRAQGTLIPSMLGTNFFNYGMDAIRDDVILFFLEQECKQIKKNPFVLLTFELEGYTYDLGDPNSYILNSNNPEIRKLLGEKYEYYYKIPFIKYYGKYEFYFKDYLNERMMLTKYKDRGASIEKNVLTKEKFDFLVDERKKTTTLFKNDSILENKYINLFKTNSTRAFIIVIPPYHPSYFYQYKNYDAALHFLSYLSQFPNIRVLNYSHFFYPDDCYMNTSHLNYKGALLFNNMIKDTLQKIINHY